MWACIGLCAIISYACTFYFILYFYFLFLCLFLFLFLFSSYFCAFPCGFLHSLCTHSFNTYGWHSPLYSLFYKYFCFLYIMHSTFQLTSIYYCWRVVTLYGFTQGWGVVFHILRTWVHIIGGLCPSISHRLNIFYAHLPLFFYIFIHFIKFVLHYSPWRTYFLCPFLVVFPSFFDGRWCHAVYFVF